MSLLEQSFKKHTLRWGSYGDVRAGDCLLFTSDIFYLSLAFYLLTPADVAITEKKKSQAT